MLFHFLNLYVDKKTLAKAVACTIIFNTASTMTNLSRDAGASRRQVLKKEFLEAARGYRVYIQQNTGSDFFG